MALEFLQDVIFGSDSFTITSGSTSKPEVFIATTGNNNKPSILTFTKDKGAAGANDDGIGAISFVSDNDAQQQTMFGSILYSVESATDGQEEGRIDIGVAALNSGGNNSANVLQGVGNGQNVTDVTIGLGATNVTTIAGTLTMGSTAFVNNSGVIQVATQGTIDHDSLANFVAAEHYRWDNDISATATINAANIPTLNQSTTGNAATATALTAGDKTISGDLTVTSGTSGDATLIISADTDNSEEADSPRLWFKADGDITQGAIQHNDNTFDFISNVSANGGFRFLTGTTNNTGTTDPSNGATERVSIGSTGMTISGNLTSNNIFLPGAGVISFDDSLDGTDQFISGTDNALTIDADDVLKIRADTKIEVKDTSNATTVEITSNSGDIYTAGNIELGHASDTTVARSAAGTVEIEGNQVVTAGVGTGNLMHIVLKDMQSYMFYLYNDDSWYSNGTTTLAILGSSTDPSAISSSNSEYQGRVPSYIAPQACVVKKLCFSFYWSSSAVNSADIDFGFSKFTPISDGTAASITMNKIDATDHNGSYTEVKPYYKTFTFSGANATLAAGDAFAMHMRTTGGSNAQRVLVYATATLEIELS